MERLRKGAKTSETLSLDTARVNKGTLYSYKLQSHNV